VHQVWADLHGALAKIGTKVFEAGAHLVSHEMLPTASEDADVLVFTPARADLLLRVNTEFLDEVVLVIVDEAHHIEQESRSVLLEFYLAGRAGRFGVDSEGHFILFRPETWARLN
jgi:replicative superfamily II helicase